MNKSKNKLKKGEGELTSEPPTNSLAKEEATTSSYSSISTWAQRGEEELTAAYIRCGYRKRANALIMPKLIVNLKKKERKKERKKEKDLKTFIILKIINKQKSIIRILVN